MKESRSIRRITVVAAALACLQFAGVQSAFAIEEAGGSCDDGASSADFGTWYTADGAGNNTVDYYEYLLTNPNGLGGSNNVDIQHYRNVSLGRDELLSQYTSGDDVAPNVVNRTPAMSGLTTPDGQAHTRFEFVFDNAFADDNCNADTDDF